MTLPGTGAIVAADDVGGVALQRVKVVLGADGVNDGDVASGNPLPVSLATAPLPTGAALAANQAAAAVLTGAVDETAPVADTASSGLNGRLQRIAQRITTQMARLPAALGQTTKDASLSVTLASNQEALPLPTGAATAANQTTAQASLTSLDTKLPAQGQALAAGSVPVVLPVAQVTTLTPPAAITGFATETTLGTRLTETDFDAKVGGLTETAPATDTASSGLNGRLQRLAQRLTSLLAVLPASLGQKAMTASLPVVVASDQSAVPVSGTVTANAGTGTLAVSAASLPLPSGAATLAKQPALGTAGSASADVLTVQGAASMTPLTAGGVTLTTSLAVAMTTHASYVSGDFVGTDATPLSFTNMVRVSGGTGVLQSVVVLDKATQSAAGELWLFNASITPPNDSAAWSISDADAALCIGVIPVSTYYASALNSIGMANNLGLPIKITSGTTLFGCWVTRGAPAYASNDLVILLKVLAD